MNTVHRMEQRYQLHRRLPPGGHVPPPADFHGSQAGGPSSLPPSLTPSCGYRPDVQCLSWEVPRVGQFPHHLSGGCCLKWVGVRSSGAHRSALWASLSCSVWSQPLPCSLAALPSLQNQRLQTGWPLRWSEDPASPTDTDIPDKPATSGDSHCAAGSALQPVLRPCQAGLPRGDTQPCLHL